MGREQRGGHRSPRVPLPHARHTWSPRSQTHTESLHPPSSSTFALEITKHSRIKMAHRLSQLSLVLPSIQRWGGSRRGAGRKPSDNPQMPHVTRERFATLPAHVTLRMRRDVPSLRTMRIVHEVERTFAAGCVRPGFRLVHYSLQGNHAHLIVEARDRDALGRGMKAVGARLARAVNRAIGRRGGVLSDRYHHRLLPTPKEVHHALRYVLLNARRHTARARLAVAVLDPASSARWFDGWRPGQARSIPRGRAAPTERPAVARPRTWLLAIGWRRHGLLDPRDVPG
jgi:REP-associated tyrosine transposase